MHDQRHLQFLAEVSSRNVSVNVNQSSDTEPPKLDPQPIGELQYIFKDNFLKCIYYFFAYYRSEQAIRNCTTKTQN